jgi:hypothetical protein
MRRLIAPMFLLVAVAPVAIAQSASPAPKARSFTWNSSENSDRAMLGISTGSSGRRDTLGLFIESITDGGPADKAGLEEGNRIASINGVNLKVAREDAGESDMSGAMTNRLIREMRKLKAGDEVTLQVWADGHYKTVKVKTIAAKELESKDDGAGDFAFAMRDMPRIREQLQDELPRIREDLRSEMPQIRENIQNEMPRIREELRDEMPRVRAELDNAMPRIREQLDNQLPQAMDEMRRSMDRMRLEIPQLTMRVRHRVII